MSWHPLKTRQRRRRSGNLYRYRISQKFQRAPARPWSTTHLTSRTCSLSVSWEPTLPTHTHYKLIGFHGDFMPRNSHLVRQIFFYLFLYYVSPAWRYFFSPGYSLLCISANPSRRKYICLITLQQKTWLYFFQTYNLNIFVRPFNYHLRNSIMA